MDVQVLIPLEALNFVGTLLRQGLIKEIFEKKLLELLPYKNILLLRSFRTPIVIHTVPGIN